MYEAFYGLKAKPFRLTPDPRFLYISSAHKKALAYLRYGVYRSEGFVVVMGPPGTGKTTLVKAVISELPQDEIVVSKIMSTNMSAEDLLRSFCGNIGVPFEGTSKAGLINGIEDYLREQLTLGKHVLLMVDEAHKLSKETLEELRMLTNFQQDDRALLQCFLIGQNELRGVVSSPDMEQLQQRVIASCQLHPLTGSETVAYIEHRLACAGLQGDPVFSFGAYEKIHEWTSGVPRRINELCDRMLLRGFLDEQDVINDALAVEVISEMDSERGMPPVAERENDDVDEMLGAQQVTARAAGGGSLRLVNNQALPALSEQDIARYDTSGGRGSKKIDTPIFPAIDDLPELNSDGALKTAPETQQGDRPVTGAKTFRGHATETPEPVDHLGIPDIPEESDLEPQLQEVVNRPQRYSNLDNEFGAAAPAAKEPKEPQRHVHPDQAKFEATVYRRYQTDDTKVGEDVAAPLSKLAALKALLKKASPYLGAIAVIAIVLLLIFLP